MGQKADSIFNQAKVKFSHLPTKGLIIPFKCQWCGVKVERTDGNCLNCFRNNDVHKSDLRRPVDEKSMSLFKDD
jgi:predicted ATP-dependent serine protease